MRAKFDRILVPIAGELIAEDQRRTINFDAFFANVMFHEVAHGLGIKRTIDGKGTVRAALKEQASALEEGKADILGLYMVTRLLEQKRADRHDARGPLRHLPGEHLPLDPLRRHRGARPRQRRRSSPTSRSRARSPAIRRGRYRVDFPKMRVAVDSLGGADPQAARATATTPACATSWRPEASSSPELQGDLARLGGKGIPVDVVFEQGAAVLGLGR